MKRANIRWYAVSLSEQSGIEVGNNDGGLDRVPGVGVRAKGSEGDVTPKPIAEAGRETGCKPSEFDDDDDEEGRSSSAGGTMPSSVCSQSIWTNIVDTWLRRLDCRILINIVAG
jgi:hypothetical protein